MGLKEYTFTENLNNIFKSKWYLQLALFALIFTLYGCAAVGTKTIYRTDNVPSLQRIGYCDLYDNETLVSIYPQTNDVFHSAITEIFKLYGFPTPEKTGFVVEEKKSISEFCENNNIDALLFTNLHFINVTYTVYFAPVASNLDTEVKMRLYDRQGNLLYSTMHNTLKGNSYMMPPPTNRAVSDGVKGAFNRIAKEMRLKSVK